ncbi:MAG: terpene cyclase/mutase family protein [Planctomycetes bacterium]|nr:terpene cyclase/mutase family protein [Planctomycetota bacterium]
MQINGALRKLVRRAVIVLIFVGCEQQQLPPEQQPYETADLRARIDEANAAAVGFLLSKQSADGAWRSETYGALTDGITLTPPVMKTLMFGPPSDEALAAIQRAAEYLRSWVNDDGTIELQGRAPDFPVYSASLSVIALSRLPMEGFVGARDAWLSFLREHQLTEPLGWDRVDLAFGGWGYSVFPPHKPQGTAAERPPFDADLSSTLFAIGALRLAGVWVDDPSIENALVFVKRCQNYNEMGGPVDSQFDDGGFFFTPTNDLQNKAGSAGTDREGRLRYHSYGTATADGIRALLRCGLQPDDPRVEAARRWLEDHFSTTTVPGVFEPMREQDRDAAYYYYCWSVSHAFRQLTITTIRQNGRSVNWADDLAKELLRRQRDDGSWANHHSFVKEDDPLIGTTLAAAALANCRQILWPDYE